MTNELWEEIIEEVEPDEEEGDFNTSDHSVNEPSFFKDSPSYEEEKFYWQDN